MKYFFSINHKLLIPNTNRVRKPTPKLKTKMSQIITMIESAMNDYVVDIVKQCSEKYGFDFDEAIDFLQIDTHQALTKSIQKPVVKSKPTIVKERKITTTTTTKQKVGSGREAPSINGKQFPLPFYPEVMDGFCHAVVVNQRLFSQCFNNPSGSSEDNLCVKCVKEAAKNNGLPPFGFIQQRIEAFNRGEQYRDPTGRTEYKFEFTMKKFNLTEEYILSEVSRLSLPFDTKHLPSNAVEEKKTKTNPRAKKASKVILSNKDDDFVPPPSPRKQEQEDIFNTLIPTTINVQEQTEVSDLSEDDKEQPVKEVAKANVVKKMKNIVLEEEPVQKMTKKKSTKVVVQEPVKVVVQEPVKEVVQEPVKEVVQEPVKEVVQKMIKKKSTKVVVQEPVKEVVQEPVKEVVQKMIKKKSTKVVVQEPVKEVVQEPVKEVVQEPLIIPIVQKDELQFEPFSPKTPPPKTDRFQVTQDGIEYIITTIDNAVYLKIEKYQVGFWDPDSKTIVLEEEEESDEEEEEEEESDEENDDEQEDKEQQQAKGGDEDDSDSDEEIIENDEEEED